MDEANLEGVIKNYENGVLYFSNTGEQDFVAMWNSVEYIFPANSRSPMLIPNTTPEELREIRKRFATAYAKEHWHNSKEYKKMVKEGGRIPAIPNDKVLDIYIQACLNPLPIKPAKVQAGPKEKRTYSGKSKPVKKDGNLNQEFKDETPDALGEM